VKLFSAIIAAFLLGTGAAHAQRLPVGDRTSSDAVKGTDLKSGQKAESKDTRRVVQEFARCVARNNSARVAKFLDDEMASFRKLLGSRATDCLGNSAGDESRLSGSGDTFRYALAEAFLLQRYGNDGVQDIDKVALLTPAGSHRHGLGALSECIIRKSPVDSWALLQTDAASPDEKSRFEALLPSMQPCVDPSTTVKISAFFVRGAIADTFYRLSKAPHTTSGARN
jgi:hypothetical protein